MFNFHFKPLNFKNELVKLLLNWKEQQEKLTNIFQNNFY